MDAGGPFNLLESRWTADIRAVDKICYYGDYRVMISHPPDGTMWIDILRNNGRKITHRERVLAKRQTSPSLVGEKLTFFSSIIWNFEHRSKSAGKKTVFLSLPSPSVNYGIAKFCYFYIFTHFYSNNGVSSAASLRAETYRSPGEFNFYSTWVSRLVVVLLFCLWSASDTAVWCQSTPGPTGVKRLCFYEERAGEWPLSAEARALSWFQTFPPSIRSRPTRSP